MAPLQGNQFLQLDPDQKRRASSRVTDPLSHLALLDASSPKGGAFCHLPVSTDKAPPFRGSWQNRQVLPERVPPIAAIRLGLCVKMSLSRPTGRDKLKNIKFIPLIMAERSGAIFSIVSSFRKPKFPKYAIYTCQVLFLRCKYCILVSFTAGFACQNASQIESIAFQSNQERGIL